MNKDYNDDDIITLLSDKGEEMKFTEIAGIAYKNSFYAILQPVELLDGMDDDEALVFKVTKGSDGEDKFEIELDDNIIDAVFEEYNKLYDEAHANDGPNNVVTTKDADGNEVIQLDMSKKTFHIMSLLAYASIVIIAVILLTR